MRIVLHTGKGGVGKSTLSAATAIACARTGRRTLLLSTDAAHSVGDILDQPMGADPEPVEGVPDLWAAHVDVRSRFEQAWSAVRSYLVGVLATRGVSEVTAEELTVLPGADEIVALLEIHRHAASGDFDVIVADCAPSGETLRLLALPETLAFYADRVLGAPVTFLRGLAQGLAGLTRNPRPGAPDAEVKDALLDLLARLRTVRELLSDPDVAGIRLVLTPERVVVAEARRLWTALCLHGFGVESVLVNRIWPEELDMAGWSAWQQSQREALTAMEESFASLPVLRVPLQPAEPVGAQALTALADQLFDGADPVPVRPRPPMLTVTAEGGGYELRLALPLADHGQVDLSRSGDDLVVTVGPHRRRLALPSLLRRCATVGARFDGDALVVAFVPDPNLWPAAVPQPEPAGAAR